MSTHRWTAELVDGTEIGIRALVEADVAKQQAFFDVASAPFVYGMIVPFLTLDLALWVYQAVCFRLYRIPPVRRGDYIVIDRHQLSYLNAMEKLNCVYCGYANGLISYTREIAARTEQYWCPIKHARGVVDAHRRYAQFAEFGDAELYREHSAAMRSELARIGNKHT